MSVRPFLISSEFSSNSARILQPLPSLTLHLGDNGIEISLEIERAVYLGEKSDCFLGVSTGRKRTPVSLATTVITYSIIELFIPITTTQPKLG